MKLDLRVDSDDEDQTITRLIAGMTDYFETRTGWRLNPASYEALVGSCRQQVTIERGPLRAVDGIFYWDADSSAWILLSDDEYITEPRGRDFDIIFTNAGFSTLPAYTALRQLPVRMQFSAGFDSPEVTDTSVNGNAEDGMIVSLKALVARAYEDREAGGGAGTWTGANPVYDYLLGAYRKFW